MAKILAAAMLGAILLAAPSAGNAQPEPTGQGPIEVPPAGPPLVIGSGDLISVTVFDAPELSGRFRVDQKGDVEMPLLQPIHLAGLTAEQAAKRIEDQYVQAQILVPDTSPSTVFIEEYASQGITVSGEVKNPGVYPAFGVRRLNDVVTAAGGATELASSNVIVTHRSDREHPVTIAYDPGALPQRVPGGAQIFPGDTVMVPRAGIVYVLGAVNKPGGFVLNGHDTLTTMKAMALAGGISRAPALNSTQLVRNIEDGRKIVFTVPLERVLKGTAPDVNLKDGDVLYVPTSTRKVVTQQAIVAALAVGTAIAIYKVAYH
jgi:polysaccharide export outer membrane protein